MDPKILPALDEISAVLKKHDLTGIMIVSSVTHVDFRMNLESSWSIAKLEPLPEGGAYLKIKCRRADFSDLEEYKARATAGVGMFVSMSDAMRHLQSDLAKILEAIGRQINFLGKSIREE